MNEINAIQSALSDVAILDTVLNVTLFLFIGILVWLYTKAPVHLDD